MFAKEHRLGEQKSLTLESLPAGTPLALKDTLWDDADLAVMLALSKGCNYCSAIEALKRVRELGALGARFEQADPHQLDWVRLL
jgi:hypothetical protein